MARASHTIARTQIEGMSGTSEQVAEQIRGASNDGASPEHAAGVQWFFKDEIKSRGWYTAALRRAARNWRNKIRKEYGLDFLVQVADDLFSGTILEEKVAAVFLPENLDPEFGDHHSHRFEAWLDRISGWADPDGLVHCLIAPMVSAQVGSDQGYLSLGKVPESLAATGGLRGADSWSAGKNVLP